MARTRRYRRRFRTKTGKWASNIVDIGPSTFVLAPSSFSVTEITLATNPAYANSSTSSIKKVKNFEVAINIDAVDSLQGIENLQFYIMFVPEGMAIGDDYTIRHPEYIMAMRYYGEPGIDRPSTSQYANLYGPPLRIRSRLSRNLNTGDRVILLVRAANTTTSNLTCQYSGLCRWWSKAN